MTTSTTKQTPHPGPRTGRQVTLFLAGLFGLYLIGRAIAEPWVIDVHDPGTYHLDWGGPNLAGVLAVHCGPGLLALAAMITAAVLAVRRRAR